MIRCISFALHPGRWILVLGLVLLSDWQAVRLQAGEASQAATTPDQPKSSPAALAAYARAANFQNNSAFDLASEAWQGFLQQFPDDPKAIDARYHLGVCLLQLKDYSPARQAFQAVVDSAADFDRREDALLNLGWTLYCLALKNETELLPQADQVFATLLKEFPEGQYRDQALFFRGESFYLQARRKEAADAYRQLVDQFPDSELRDDSLYALGVTLEEQNEFAQAGQLYDQFLKDFPQHELVPEVKMRKAETILRGGDVAEAARRFAEVAAIPGFRSVDHALYRQAFCAARLGNFAEAATLFARIPREFPQSEYRADATIAAARSYFSAEQLDEAAQWLDQVIAAQDTHSVEAVHWRARLLLKQRHPQEALQLVEQYLPKAEGDRFFVNLKMDQADALYEMPERQAESIPLYAQLVQTHPQHVLAPQALYNAAFGTMQRKQYRQALEFAEQFRQQFPEHRLLPDVKHVTAECQLQLGQNEAAAEMFGELARTYSDREDSVQWAIRQALALYMQRQYRDALQVLQEQQARIQGADDRAESLYVAGMSHFGLAEFDAARDALQKSLEAQPRWRQADEALLNLSRAQRRLKEFGPARASVERLLREFPESGLRDQAHFRLAENAYAQGDYQTAVDHHSLVLQDWPGSNLVPLALYGRGWAQLRQEQRELAEADFTQLIEQHPDSSVTRQALYARALCRQQTGQYEASLADLDAFQQRELSRQEQSDALYVRGLDQVGLGQLAAAIATFESIVRDDPQYNGGDKVLYELAWSLKNDQQSDRAVPIFAQLAEQRPDSPLAAEAFYHVGEEAYRQGKYQAAAEAYEKAIGGGKQGGELLEKAQYKLGWARYQLEDYPGALQAFQQQLDQQPDGTLAGDAHFLQGECHFKMQNHELAMRSFRAATARRLSSPQMELLARLHAGQTAGQMENWQESLQWLEELPANYADSPLLPQVLYETGVAHQQLGDLEQAARRFGEAADQTTGELSAQARFMVGEVLYARKDYVPAIREFRKVLFGFGEEAGPEIQRWQAKAGLEAGQCAAVMASQQSDTGERRRLLDLARQLLRHVQKQYPELPEAAAAADQLKRFGG